MIAHSEEKATSWLLAVKRLCLASCGRATRSDGGTGRTLSPVGTIESERKVGLGDRMLGFRSTRTPRARQNDEKYWLPELHDWSADSALRVRLNHNPASKLHGSLAKLKGPFEDGWMPLE
jgi:hypothetical protein